MTGRQDGGESTMRIPRLAAVVAVAAIALAACTSPGGSTSASASGSAAAECTVAVSWNNFQQPRWAATDKPNIQQTVEAAGYTYMDHDANLKSDVQLTDVDTFISQGANVLILLAQDQDAILPALQKAKDAGIPVIAYDRIIEDPSVLYITFDNVAVGKAEAEALMKKVPEGNYVLIKGDPGDANASTFLPQGWVDAGLKDAIDAGKITVLNGPAGGGGNFPDDYGTFTDAWDTQTAQDNMEQIIDKANADGKQIDAVLAENDSTAVGVAQALEAKSYGFPPLSGQDGDKTNLNNVALGKQYVDIWKNSVELGKAAGQAAVQLCQGKTIDQVTIDVDPSVAPTAGNTPTDFESPGGNTLKSLILQPTPVTAENLNVPIDAGWYVTKDQVCAGVKAGDPGADLCGV
jgi:D-xylose transport system substrate-binding protein